MGPVLALVLTSVIWGAAPPIFKFAYENIPPFTLGFLRFALAVLVLTPFLKGRARFSMPAREWTFLLAASFAVALHLALFFVGLERTESINVSIIGAVGPIFLYFASIRFLKEKKNTKVLTGMVIGLIGSFIVVVSPLLLGTNSFELGQFGGNLLIVLSTLFDMLSIMLMKRSMKHLHPIVATVVIFAVCALVFYPLALREMTAWSFSQLDYRGVIGIIFGAFFSSSLAYYLRDYGISKINAEEVGIFSYISPIVTVLIAVPLLKEYPDPFFYLGAALVFAGVIIAERKFSLHMAHMRSVK